jgi:hypothetical protein
VEVSKIIKILGFIAWASPLSGTKSPKIVVKAKNAMTLNFIDRFMQDSSLAIF